jgi:hypothetical protein
MQRAGVLDSNPSPRKDVEILALRRQLTVLAGHLASERMRFNAGDRALFLAALLHRLPRAVLCRVRLLVRPRYFRVLRRLLDSGLRGPAGERLETAAT